jgi:DNA-binding NtrC family response regulator
MSDSDRLELSDFPPTVAMPSPLMSEAHHEPLIIEPASHAAPAMISGTEIPIAPLPATGMLSMLTNVGEVRPLEELESEIIRFAISHYRGQMSEVARRLKIGRSTLYRKLDEAAAADPSAGGTDQSG